MADNRREEALAIATDFVHGLIGTQEFILLAKVAFAESGASLTEGQWTEIAKRLHARSPLPSEEEWEGAYLYLESIGDAE